MHVRVDQWAERLGALNPGIEVEAQFSGEAQVGSLARRDHDAVNWAELAFAFCGLTGQDHLVPGGAHGSGGKAGHQGDTATVHQLPEVGAELASCWQLVSVSTSIHAHQIGAPGRPKD